MSLLPNIFNESTSEGLSIIDILECE
jgi:hypothetical protein